MRGDDDSTVNEHRDSLCRKHASVSLGELGQIWGLRLKVSGIRSVATSIDSVTRHARDFVLRDAKVEELFVVLLGDRSLH